MSEQSTAQFQVVAQDAPNPSQALGRVAFFDEEGNPVTPGGGSSLPVGTLADLEAGTSQVAKSWKAKDLADYVTASIPEGGGGGEGGGTSVNRIFIPASQFVPGGESPVLGEGQMFYAPALVFGHEADEYASTIVGGLPEDWEAFEIHIWGYPDDDQEENIAVLYGRAAAFTSAIMNPGNVKAGTVEYVYAEFAGEHPDLLRVWAVIEGPITIPTPGLPIYIMIGRKANDAGDTSTNPFAVIGVELVRVD